MPVNLNAPDVLHPVTGVRVATASLGQRKEPRHDLTVFEIAAGSSVAATFTQSTLCAAPVIVAREHLAIEAPRALMINAGNANACSGQPGMEAARRSCEQLAGLLDVPPAAVLPFSTGVIGEALDTDAMARALPVAVQGLREDGWLDAGQAILTTDIVAKGSTRRFELNGVTCTVTGIAKGSGMIHPDMATMLAFIGTDANVTRPALDALLRESVERSFNRVTVDGDTSTNDACVLVATGASGADVIDGADSAGHADLREAVLAVCTELAHAIVRDGEGATKFVTVRVSEGRDAAECRRVAFTIAHSPLVKTALYASDANWGRICMAVGRAGVENMDPARVRIWLDEVQIVDAGGRAPGYTEEQGAGVMARKEITIHVALGRGEGDDTVWTCDFSHQYVTINADYRS
jgi:glutamate N-acetyltransferase/amino-acid N-acetyltransferase